MTTTPLKAHTLLSLLRACLALTPRGQYGALLGLLALTAVCSFLEVAGVAMVLPFIAIVADPQLILTQPHVARIYAFSGLGDPRTFTIVIGLGFVLIVLIKNVLIYYQSKLQSRISFLEAARLGSALFRRFLAMPFAVHLQRHSTTAITTCNHATDQVFAVVLMAYLGALAEILTIVGIASVLFIAEPWVTFASLVLIGLLAALLYRTLRPHMTAFGIANNYYYELRLRILGQGLASLKELKVLGREEYLAAAYEGARVENAGELVKNSAIQQIPRLTVETVLVAGIIGVMILALISGRSAAAITGTLGLFAVSAFRLMPAMNRLIMHFNNIEQGAPSVERVYAEMAAIAGEPRQDAEGPAVRFTNQLEFRAVGFAYKGGDKPALEDISYTIECGQSVGIVGPSGAGKSTLADLLLGLLQPTHGTILVDSQDISRNVRSWQSLIGYVPQAIHIAADSIRRNVAYGLPDAAIDQTRVLRALEMAHLSEVLAGLPDGLDTILGENGARLSGGQCQRIGLARALYHDPAVLIMDEATSALDTETEREISAVMADLHGRKTLITIAHRLTTLKNCDKLILVKDGRLLAQGDFQSLNHSNSYFRQLVELSDLGATAHTPS